ncbi:beta-ketoacyl synthase N-terminal-like domain-containing protein [uncultured Pontibacter sp.]|uniref:beta-ketoacyl synthase N-terminal-like domain-containing protein n=1 Tax=uncultured Pontibacter sp. TaxID=453356 RepID=UPI00260D986D|nr:beta-ketoacyl synthase N-terminal-like domain-containing protein [uncultured Pontibacter sp.]
MDVAREHIVIRACGAISPLGYDEATVTQAYLAGSPSFQNIPHQGKVTPVASLSAAAEEKIQELIATNSNYRQLDRSVLLAIYAARQAAEQAGWLTTNAEQQADLAVNIGSSRGATGLFEHHYDSFQKENLSPSSSPTTTLGNLSSWVGHAVNAGGAQISHSITCSTALMAIANGMAWLRAGMATRFLAGGTEAPLTDFTIAQMKAVGIYSKLYEHPYPCQPYGSSGQNTFVLGEGAAVFALEKSTASTLKPGDIIVESAGFGFEQIGSKTGISVDGLNFQKSMRHALSQINTAGGDIDVIITHTPGTKAGDSAELNAINAVFPHQRPLITTNKWLLGHTLGASGALSLQYALYLLRHQQVPFPQYPVSFATSTIPKIRCILLNAAGFGGNATSLLLRIIE